MTDTQTQDDTMKLVRHLEVANAELSAFRKRWYEHQNMYDSPKFGMKLDDIIEAALGSNPTEVASPEDAWVDMQREIEREVWRLMVGLPHADDEFVAADQNR